MKMLLMKTAAILGGAGLIGYAIVLCNPKLAEEIKKKALNMTDEVSNKIKEEID